MEWIKDNQKYIIGTAIAILCVVIAALGYKLYMTTDKREPVIITKQQADDPVQLAKEIKINVPQATEVVRYVESSQPNVTYTVAAPSVQQAATDTAAAIKRNDSTLPAGALEKTDRTAIVANTDQQKVDVYKINLNKSHKIKAGVTYVDNKVYSAVGYQAGRVEGLVHLNSQGKVQGSTIVYTLKEW